MNCKCDVSEKSIIYIYIIYRPAHPSKSALPTRLKLRLVAEVRTAQVVSDLVSSLVHLTAGRAPRVKEARKRAANVLGSRCWLRHVRQRTQHVLFRGKLGSSARFKCVSKLVVKDAIYSVFQKPLSKFLKEVTSQGARSADKVQPARASSLGLP